jgi:hypothetical protein
LKKFYFLLFIFIGICSGVNAQKASYGDVDIADLKMTSCEFEKNAGAMVLFDVAVVNNSKNDWIFIERHKRIKIFNDNGTSAANIRLSYISVYNIEEIKNIEAQTINLVNGRPEITILDKKSIYTQKMDKQHKAYIFTMPNVKAGSVIELKYRYITTPRNYPNWLFQGKLPVRYSELDASILDKYRYNVIRKTTQNFITDVDVISENKFNSRHLWAMANIPSFRVETYMNSLENNLQGIYFKKAGFFTTWKTIKNEMLEDSDFGAQLKIPLEGEAKIMIDAGVLTKEKEKIAYIFNTVKNRIKWNEVDHWYTDEGIKKAWLNKTGNSTEINIILYRLLKLAGIKVSLLSLGTREIEEIELNSPSFANINKTVVRVPLDSVANYVLDASGKFNVYNETPYDLLGRNMLTVDPDDISCDIVKLATGIVSKEVIFVNAEVKPSGKLEGSVQKTTSDYKRISTLEDIDKIGEKKYVDEELKQDNRDLQISAHRFTYMEVDTVPLREDFDFKLDLTASDENYIYFNPNLFTGIGENPFISETRLSDIDFIYLNNYAINGHYKIPIGYKTDALPKSMKIVMPDNSISFKRVIAEYEGAIVVNYIIDFKKTYYKRDEYSELREFFRRMHEMLNEQVVLKKN